MLKCDKSLDFGIGDPNSTSGFLVPTTFVFSAKSIDPNSASRPSVPPIMRPMRSRSPTSSCTLLLPTTTKNLERLAKTSPEKAKEIRVIWTSPLIASDPLVWRKDLDAGLKDKIATWLFDYGNTDSEKAILAELGWTPFKKSGNNQVLPIRQMEVNRAIMKLQADEKIAAEDKTAKLADLQKQFSELGNEIASLKK